MKKRILALFLALFLLCLCLSSCHSRQAAAEQKTAFNAKYAYKAKTVPLVFPDDVESVENLTLIGNRLYGVYTRYVENDLYSSSYEYLLCEINISKGTVQVLDWYEPIEPRADCLGDSSIYLLRGDKDGNLWIADSTTSYRFNLPDTFYPETDNVYDYYEDVGVDRRVCCYNANGKLLKSIELPEKYADAALVSIDERNQLYFADWEKAYVLDADGKLLKTIDLKDGGLTEFCGKPAMESYGENYSVHFIDPETFSAGEKIQRPAAAWSAMPANKDGFDYFYLNNSNLYGYTASTDTSELIVDWMDLDIDPGDISDTIPLPDGRFIGVCHDYSDYKTSTSLIILTEVDPATIPQKTTLTLACMYIDYNLRSQIVDFNKKSDSVRIVISDYSQYATEDDYEAGLTKLNTEIMAGQVPDLFVAEGLPIAQYIAAGVIEPLNDRINADSALDMQDLVSGVVQAASVDGKLYLAFAGFRIETVAVLQRVAGNYKTWDLPAVKDAMGMLQKDATFFSEDYTRDDVMRSCIANNVNRFIDWQTGTCSFDSQDFKDLLQFSAQFPTEFDWDSFDWSKYTGALDNLRNGQQLMAPQTIYSMYDYLYILAGAHDDVAFVGYPSTDGNGSSFRIENAICMSSSCADKDAAWSFLRTFFTEDYQNEQIIRYQSAFPSNQAAFDAMLKDAMTVEYQLDENDKPYLDENGQKVVVPKATYYVDETTQYDLDVLSQKQADLLRNLIASTTTLSGENEAVFSIIQEEAGAFFEGQRSLDDVCSMIQNRVGLYVAEQS